MRFFHLGIGGATLSAEGIASIEKALESAPDWYRHGAYTWIVYADGSLDEWRDRLRLAAGLSGKTSFLLSELDPDKCSGYLLEGGWNFLRRER